MLNKSSLEKKINAIAKYIKEMDQVLKFSDKEIKSDFTKLRTIERNFQLIVDTIVGINFHIIARKNFDAPDDHEGTFSILAANDVLPDSFAFRISPTVGLRNSIVHKYDKVTVDLFLRILRKNKGDFKKYVILIEKYLK